MTTKMTWTAPHPAALPGPRRAARSGPSRTASPSSASRSRRPLLARPGRRVALVLAAVAVTLTAGLADARRPPAAAALRTAVLAGGDIPSGVARAEARAVGGTVRLAGGADEARALAPALAADGYDVVVGVGPQARAAVGEAQAALPDGPTVWRTVR